MKINLSASFRKNPTTRLGRWAVGLAIAYLVMNILNYWVIMRLPEDVPWRQTVLPYFGVFMMLCGLAAGIIGLIAILRVRERSWLVWLTLLPGISALVLVVGAVLLPLLLSSEQTPTVTGYESSPPSAEALPTFSAEQIPIIFDDDGSPDGTTALLYLLSHPQADLKAVNISYGEAHPEIYIQHIGRTLDAFDITGIPFGYGQDAPLAGSNEFPEEVRQSANNFWGLPIANAELTYPAQSAPELMVSAINQSPVPVTIFVSGPSTNLAQALRIDPDIKQNIAAVYMMGGAIYVPGNIYDFYPAADNHVAEWNIYADPQAAKEVFESGLDIYLVPLDATNQMLISKQDTRQWHKGGEIADFAAELYEMLLNNWGAENSAIWDLMTAAIMLNPDLCGFQPVHLQVITQAGDTSGQTVVISGEEANSYVCLEPDVDRIRQTLINVFASSD